MFSLMPSKARREGGSLATREYTPFELLRREFSPLFDRSFPNWLAPFEPVWFEMESRRFDVEETDHAYMIRAEVPGFAPNEVEVRLTGNVLTMRAERAEPAKTATKEPVERRHDVWERTLTLPSGVDPERVEARCHNGVLEVRVPKAPELAPRRIEVKT